MIRKAAYNTGFASGGVTCKLGAMCFYSSFVQVDSFVLRNPPERKARNRYRQFHKKSCQIVDLEELTTNIFAEKILTQFDSKKYIDWAINVMELGYESENLFILAGLDNELTQLREQYFWKTIKDLNISVNKTDAELIQNYAKFIAQKVIDNEIDIDNAFRIMLRICSTTGYEQRYIPFYEIDEDLDYLFYDNSILFNSGLTKENKTQFIREEFKIFYEMERLNIPLDKRNLWYCKNCNSLDQPKLKTKYQLKKPHKYQTYCCSNCGSENFEKDCQKVKRLIIGKYK